MPLSTSVVISTRRSPESVRRSTAHAAPPSYVAASPHIANFQLFATSPMMTSSLPSANFRTSSAPQTRFQLTNLLKDNVDVLAPFITELINRSMSSGVFPSHFKAAFITPLLKKPNLDPSDGKSYRPISNLSVLSKLLERFVARQLIDHLNAWKLIPTLQSAYSLRQPLDGDCYVTRD